jgi:hypothetical protein
VVELRDDGFVVLKTNGFVPREGLRESFHFLAANVSEHLNAAVHNLAPDRVTPPKLEQSAFSQNLTLAQAEQLQQLARRLWAKSLQQFLQTATVAEERSEGVAGAKYRVHFGVYFNDTLQGNPTEVALPDGALQKNKRKKKS